MLDPQENARRVYRHARREALIILLVWFLALVWTVGYCYLRGYRHDPESWVVRAGLAVANDPARLQQSFGFPHWVFYGIIAPWLICTGITIAFGLLGIKDDELGHEHGEETGHAA